MQRVATSSTKYKVHTSGTFPTFVGEPNTSFQEPLRFCDTRSSLSISNVPHPCEYTSRSFFRDTTRFRKYVYALFSGTHPVVYNNTGLSTGYNARVLSHFTLRVVSTVSTTPLHREVVWRLRTYSMQRKGICKTMDFL